MKNETECQSLDRQKLAILGANEAITRLIEKAKNLGYETHVFAWGCEDPGEKVADYFYPISISEKDLILEKCKEIGICGICSITSDFAAPVVAYIARGLGLPGNPKRTDIVARNKYEMRKALTVCDEIYCPMFMEVNKDTDLSKITQINYPIIVKPEDRWSSKGVTRVNNSEELHEAICYAVSESLNGRAIIEEFMHGPEYSAECIVYYGTVNILAFTQKITTGFPHYIEIGHKQPSDIPLKQQGKIKKAITQAVKALDITNSAAHVEFRILENGEVGIIEIGARMGGDCIGTDLTPLSTGMDYIKMVIDVACGNPPDFGVTLDTYPVQIRFVINDNDIQDYYDLKPESIIRKSVFDTDFNKKIVDSSTRHGYYIYKSE